MYREGFSWVNGTCKLGVSRELDFFDRPRKDALQYQTVCGRFSGLEYNVSIFSSK